MARALWLVYVVMTLLMPHAAAAEDTSATFTLAGDLNLPPRAEATVPSMGLFLGSLNNPLPLEQFVLTAQRAEVFAYWEEYQHVEVEPAPALSPKTGGGVDRTVLHNATFTLTGTPQKGYLALDASPTTSAVHFITSAGATVEGTNQSTWQFSTGATTTPRETTDHRRFLDVPHVAVNSPGRVEASGDGEMKLYGIPLRVHSDEGEKTFPTGDFDDSNEAVRIRTARWVVLVLTDFTLAAESWKVWQSAGPDAALTWDGTATFRALGGEVAQGADARSVDAGTMRMAGSFEGTLRPISSEGVTRGLLSFSGQAEGSSLNGQALHAAPAPSRWGALLLPGFALAVLAGGAGGMFYWHRRMSKEAPPTPAVPVLTPSVAAEYYVGLAEESIQADDLAKALHWIQLAQEAVPNSADVATTMAFILGELGQEEDALAAYAEASRLDPSDGEADMNAARLALRCGKPLELVEELLVRALDRSPEFVLDVEEDVDFQALALRPAFQDALESAWWRWGGEERSARGDVSP